MLIILIMTLVYYIVLQGGNWIKINISLNCYSVL